MRKPYFSTKNSTVTLKFHCCVRILTLHNNQSTTYKSLSVPPMADAMTLRPLCPRTRKSHFINKWCSNTSFSKPSHNRSVFCPSCLSTWTIVPGTMSYRSLNVWFRAEAMMSSASLMTYTLSVGDLLNLLTNSQFLGRFSSLFLTSVSEVKDLVLPIGTWIQTSLCLSDGSVLYKIVWSLVWSRGCNRKSLL